MWVSSGYNPLWGSRNGRFSAHLAGKRRRGSPPRDRFASGGNVICGTLRPLAMLDFVRFLFRMGTKRFETTYDLVRFGANLRVVCSCGRVAVIDGRQLDQMRRNRGWPISLGYVPRKLRCSKCGRSPASALPSPNEPTVRIGPTMLERAAANRSDRDKLTQTNDQTCRNRGTSLCNGGGLASDADE